MALGAVCLCLLGFFSQVFAANYVEYCSDINTGSSMTASKHHLAHLENKTNFCIDYSIYQSLGRCHDTCLLPEYNTAFAIVQYQNCWCSNYAPGGDNETCSQTCPGFPQENCGDLAQGLYGYLALGPKPSGTGAPSSSSSSTAAPVSTVCYPPPLALIPLPVVVMLALLAAMLTFHNRSR